MCQGQETMERGNGKERNLMGTQAQVFEAVAVKSTKQTVWMRKWKARHLVKQTYRGLRQSVMLTVSIENGLSLYWMNPSNLLIDSKQILLKLNKSSTN